MNTKLIALEAARLSFKSRPTRPIDLQVLPAAFGGHALLGANGSGKTLVSEALLQCGGGLLHSGRVSCREGWSARSAKRVSFDAHQQVALKAFRIMLAHLAHPSLNSLPGSSSQRVALSTVLWAISDPRHAFWFCTKSGESRLLGTAQWAQRRLEARPG